MSRQEAGQKAGVWVLRRLVRTALDKSLREGEFTDLEAVSRCRI